MFLTICRCSALMPWLRGRKGSPLWQKLDRNVVRRADESHAPVPRRPVDGNASIHKALTDGIYVVYFIRDVAEIAAFAVSSGSQL